MHNISVCHTEDIAENSSKGFSINETSLFAVKRDGIIFLYKNSCPHLGIELEWQEDQFLAIEATLIQCSTHGALFIIESGECVAGPCLGEKLTPIAYSLSDNGMLLVDSELIASS